MTAGRIYTTVGGGTEALASGRPGRLVHFGKNSLAGVATDPAGDVFVLDGAQVWMRPAKTGVHDGRTMTAGDIYTIAGGGTETGDGTPALDADFGLPIRVVAVDSAGNVLAGGYTAVFLVAERTGSFYGRAAQAGDVYTVARSAYLSTTGDGGPAVSAMFNSDDIAVSPQTGSLLIADSLTARVRSIAR
jgi:hypothetical protein